MSVQPYFHHTQGQIRAWIVVSSTYSQAFLGFVAPSLSMTVPGCWSISFVANAESGKFRQSIMLLSAIILTNLAYLCQWCCYSDVVYFLQIGRGKLFNCAPRRCLCHGEVASKALQGGTCSGECLVRWCCHLLFSHSLALALTIRIIPSCIKMLLASV